MASSLFNRSLEENTKVKKEKKDKKNKEEQEGKQENHPWWKGISKKPEKFEAKKPNVGQSHFAKILESFIKSPERTPKILTQDEIDRRERERKRKEMENLKKKYGSPSNSSTVATLRRKFTENSGANSGAEEKTKESDISAPNVSVKPVGVFNQLVGKVFKSKDEVEMISTIKSNLADTLQNLIDQLEKYVTTYQDYVKARKTFIHKHSKPGRDRALDHLIGWTEQWKNLLSEFQAKIANQIWVNLIVSDFIEVIDNLYEAACKSVFDLPGGNWNPHSYRAYLLSYAQELHNLKDKMQPYKEDKKNDLSELSSTIKLVENCLPVSKKVLKDTKKEYKIRKRLKEKSEENEEKEESGKGLRHYMSSSSSES